MISTLSKQIDGKYCMAVHYLLMPCMKYLWHVFDKRWTKRTLSRLFSFNFLKKNFELANSSLQSKCGNLSHIYWTASCNTRSSSLEPLCSGLVVVVAKIISIFSTQRILMNIQKHSAICGCMFFSGAMHFEQQPLRLWSFLAEII